MKQIQLILSDIDGTILDEHHQVDPDLVQLMPQLKEQAILFVLASARSPRGMAPIAEQLGLSQLPLAAYNGALILQGDQVLFQHPLPSEDTSRLLTFLQQHFPTVSINLYSGADWLTDQLDEWSQLEASITGETPILCEKPTDLTSHPIHKLLLIDQADTIQQLYQQLQTMDFPQTAFYLSKANYLEVTAQKVSKEQALREVAKFYQVPLEATMALGDHFNDLPMLQLAGFGVAMGNAPQTVQEQANHVTSSNNQHGVAQAIRNFVL